MAIRYNCIDFTWPLTRYHIMGPGMDPSNSDQLYTTFRFEVQSLININVLPSVPGDTNAGTPGAISTLARVRHMLLQPRCPFYWDSTTVPGAAAAPGTAFYLSLPGGRDDANGPMPDPEAFKIKYTTPDTLEVTWACTIKLRDCGPLIPTGPLSVRWTDSLSWDKEWKCTYKRSGTMIVSSLGDDIETLRRKFAMLPGGIGPTGITPGFQRIRAHYLISKDGLSCDFEFVDEQIRFGPPAPASDLVIVQSETFPLINGMKEGNVSVAMTGLMMGSVRDLAVWALAIMYCRIWASAPNFGKNGTVIVLGGANLETTESTDGYSVRATAKYKVPPNGTQSTNILPPVTAFSWGAKIGQTIGNLFFGNGPNAGTSDRGMGEAPGIAPGGGKGGADPTKHPLFPWIGAGIDPPSPENNSTPQKPWADPNFTDVQIGPPVTGVGLGAAVALFAAVLTDPCGQTLRPSQGISFSPISGGGAVGRFPFNPPPCGPTSASPAPTPGPATGTYPYPINQYTNPPGQTVQALLTAAYYQGRTMSTPSSSSVITNTGLWSWDGLAGAYDYWQCESEYNEDPGVIVVPTCNPNGVNLAVQHSSPMLYLVKKWAARRTGAPPNLPPRDLQDSNLIFVGAQYAPRELQLGPDGVSVDYMSRGIYMYEALNPVLVDRHCEIPPFLAQTALQQQAAWSDLYESTGTNPQNPNGGSLNVLGNGQLPNNPPN